MRACCLAAWLIAGLLASSALSAQTTTQVTLNFSGTLSATVVGANVVGQIAAVGTVTPFGNAAFFGSAAVVNGASTYVVTQPFTFTFASGDSFQIFPIIGLGAGDDVVPRPSAPILGGTGIFKNATGSLNVVSPNGPKSACESDGNPLSPILGPYCPVGVQFTATGSITTPGTISVSPSALPFSFLQGNSTPASLPITLTNGTSQAVAFSATTSGQSWLSVSLSNPTAAAFSSATATVTVNPSGLTPGTYVGTVNLSASGQQFVLPVNVTVSSAQLALAISQTALRFQAAAGASAPPSQSIAVLNQGTGPLNWSAKASTLVGSWLSVTPSSGAGGGAATVSVDPTNLPPGDYYGLVQFTAAGAANSPQAAVVVFNVLPATSAVPAVEPTGLIFVGQKAGSNPVAQMVTVSNPSNQSISVVPTPLAQQNGVFSIAPTASASVASGDSAQFMVSANLSGLATGVYPGVIQFLFGDGSIQQVALALIVTPSGGASAVPAGIHAVAAGCTPTKLIPVSTGLGQSFNEVAAWPVPLIVQVVDDCGSPMGPGTVVASFSTGDPPLPLLSLGGGTWSATWEPSYISAAASAVITVQAQSFEPALTGMAQISGTLNSNQSTPAIFAGGVVSAASFAANAPLAPGGFTSIFGANFASGLNLAGPLPLVTELGGTQVVLAGELLPLLFTSSGQINAIIPYDVAPNATQQLIVLSSLAYSMPVAVTLAPAQPAVFTQDQSGTGIGVIVVIRPDGTQFEAGSSHPATAGDALVIYCAGLGAVSPSVAAGSASPSLPLAYASDTVTATVGGQPSTVLFAGLAPGFAGLYQVNLLVPSGIAAGPNVQVILAQGALLSPPVTVPIQ